MWVSCRHLPMPWLIRELNGPFTRSVLRGRLGRLCTKNIFSVYKQPFYAAHYAAVWMLLKTNAANEFYSVRPPKLSWSCSGDPIDTLTWNCTQCNEDDTIQTIFARQVCDGTKDCNCTINGYEDEARCRGELGKVKLKYSFEAQKFHWMTWIRSISLSPIRIDQAECWPKFVHLFR